MNHTERRLLSKLACFVVLLMLVNIVFASDASLSPEERQEMTDLLEESRDLLVGLIESTNDEQWTFKPAPDRWSVAECAEHIIRSERALLDSARAAMATQPDPEWSQKTKGKADLLRNVMPNRRPQGQGGATAPQEIRPQGGLSQAQLLEEFAALRAEVITYIDGLEGEVKSHLYEHPFPIFGDLNAHDWLLYIPLHTIRHSRQIVEVKESEGYPEG